MVDDLNEFIEAKVATPIQPKKYDKVLMPILY